MKWAIRRYADDAIITKVGFWGLLRFLWGSPAQWTWWYVPTHYVRPFEIYRESP